MMTDDPRALGSIPALALLLLLAACGGSGSGSTSTSSGAGGASTTTASSGGAGGATATATATTGSGEPMCTLYLYPDRPACQTRMDMYCCPEEQACAADPDCVTYTDCLYACDGSTNEACLNTCGMNATQAALNELNAIGKCSGAHPPLKDQSCSYP